jgi:putative Mg2+ transporter-C (MgtC) family protein
MVMDNEYLVIILHLVLSVIAGGAIGLERAYHGRPAGFRTHTLVCAASTLLMLLVLFHGKLILGTGMVVVQIDPTRMAQGIMTGIGFLGAGVIMKEGLTIRGLTTAASIWMTAAIGIVIGLGFYFAAVAAIVVALVTLSLFRWIEKVLPAFHYAGLSVSCVSADPMPEERLGQLLEVHKINGINTSYQLEDGGKVFRYQMTIRTRNVEGFRRLADTLREIQEVREFSITPAGD